jgi:hypothetical protein
MRWALTALVLGSVSAVVVVLSMEQVPQAVAHPGLFAPPRTLTGRLRRILQVLASVGITTGQWIGREGRSGGRRIRVLIVSTFDAVRVQAQGLAERRARRLSTPAPPAFEDSAQTTAPEAMTPTAAEGSASWFAPASRPTGWLSRISAVIELVVVIAVMGGALALVFLAVGWKAAHLH